MRKLSREKQAQLQTHLKAVAAILYEHTEEEKLQDFESIEWEVRQQILEQVAPQIGEFFSRPADDTAGASSDG